MDVPNHIGLIIDGNRRWATNRRMPPWYGHKKGAKILENLLDWCVELNIPQVSVFTLSTENLNRPKRELRELFELYYKFLEKWESKKDSPLDKYEIKLKFVGDLDRLPNKLVRLMGRLMQRTARYQKKAINLLVAYGSHFELAHVLKKMAERVASRGVIEITEKEIEKNLLVPVPIDLVIRTGGISRLSNFMLWQASYAEIYVTKVLWPDFTKKDLIKAIKWYNSVQKNFGR